jgi:DNA-binding beta-propeller fold protein YncE
MYHSNRILRLVTFTTAAALAILAAGCSIQGKPAATTPGSYAFWPDSPNLPRIQYLTSINSSNDLRAAPSRLDRMLYGKEAEQAVRVDKPYGVAMWNGRVYVCDVRGASVLVFDLKQNQMRLMGSGGVGAIRRAVDIAIAPDGTKYVADLGSKRIAVFTPDERFVRTFAFPDCSPAGVAVYEDRLYVVDMESLHVKVVNRFSGELLATIGQPGGLDGQFVRPLGIAVDSEGYIYVSDIIKCQVQRFDPEGNLVLAFGQSGNRPGYFSKPKHLKVASDGLVYAVDAAFNNVQILDEEGKAMMFFGSHGNHTGAMDLPAGIYITEKDIDLFAQYIHPAFKAERLILVTNQFGPNRVAVYAMGGLREGRTLADITPGRVPTFTEIDESAEQLPPAEEITAVQQ